MAESQLRSGDWVTAERIRNYSYIMITLTTIVLCWIVLTAHHLLMPDGQPIGTDFSGIYTAGKLALEGKAASAYDWQTHHETQHQLFGKEAPFYAWSYPPPFFLVAAAAALLPYGIALGLWQVITLCLYLYAMRRMLKPVAPESWLLPTLGFSGVFINLANGHNGFLSAFLFGLGLALLRTKPFLAGILLGALCYKPQFGLLIPFALLAAGYWRAIAGASLSLIMLCVISTAFFGTDIWPAFSASLSPSTHILLEQGNTGWHKIQSVFSFIRSIGGSIEVAYSIHALVALGIIGLTIRAWCKEGTTARNNALLIVASLLVTPYAMDYDLMLLAPAIAFLAADGLRRGFLPYQRTVLSLAWITPLLTRNLMQHSLIPLGLITLLLLFTHSLYRPQGDSPQA